MAKFKQVVETIDRTRAELQGRFDQLGRDDLGIGMRQFRARNRNPRYQRQLKAAAQFIGEVFSGRRGMWQLKEVLSTSDFPLLFGDTIDRLMVAQYREITPTWRDYLHVATVADFRSVSRFHCTRGSGRLDLISQGAGYPQDAPTESRYTYNVEKYGRRRDILWEALMNDDLDALKAAPDDLAFQAANTEMYLASSYFVNNTTLYAATGGGRPTNGNIGTAALTATNLQSALEQFSRFLGPESTPILNTPRYLVVPPALELTARQILQSATLAFKGSTDLVDQPVLNILQGILDIRVNPWIPILDGTNGHTSWYIFADPAYGWAVEVGFLRGHEVPELFMKTANQIRLGGGETAAIDGDFDTDNVAYKARHVMGGSHTNAVGGWRFTYFSNGSA